VRNALDLLHEDEARATRAGHKIEHRSLSSLSSLSNPSPWLLNALGTGSRSGAQVTADTAFNVSAVRACIDVRGTLLAMLPLHLMRKDKGSIERISATEHPLAKLFRRRVSPAHTSYSWLYTSQVCFDLGGNAYSRVVRNAFAQVESIRWTKPVDMQVFVNEEESRMGYRYKGRDLRDFEVLKVSNLSTNGYTGRSPLFDLREAVGLSLTAEEYAARAFVQGNRKPGILEGGPEMTAEKAAEFAKFWQANYSGAANAGKNPFIFGGVSWKEAGFSNADAELLLTRRFSVEEIARVYRLPLHLVGGTEKSTTWGSGIEQLNQGLVDYTLAPLCKNWESEMNTILLTEEEQDKGYYTKFGVDALLRGSFETRAKIYQMMRGIAAMDVNQIRELEDWPQYPDAWAGDPRQPLNAQGNAAMAAPQPARVGDDDDDL
jgi:HK97 family phage portal protein